MFDVDIIAPLEIRYLILISAETLVDAFKST